MSGHLRSVPSPSVRSRGLTSAEQITAVFSHPALYELAAVLPARQDGSVGRPANHPGYLLLGYGVLARVFRSGVRVQAEIAQPAVWQQLRDTIAATAEAHPHLEISAPGRRPPDWNAFRYARQRYLAEPETLAALQQRFTELAVDQAHDLGLLLPNGPGSLCHPDRSRTIYGDGTVVRPLYRPPAARRTTDPATGEATIVYLDPATGSTVDRPTRRFDPDVAEHHGHSGPVIGQNFVGLYVRGDAPHQRVVLAVDRTPAPGQEADTAVRMVHRLHAVAGSGIQAVVYDGAFRGRHLDELMTQCGVVVINKVHASSKTAARKGRAGDGAPRWFPLGTWEHETVSGPCTHQLAAVDGAVSEVGLDDAGQPVLLHRLDRKQVKRPRRASGRYHFNVAYSVPCPTSAFLAWVTPHGEPGDARSRRADATRIIAEGEPDFTRLYGLRNDAESSNAGLKRTLLVDRAMSLGGQRQLLDFLCFGLLSNAIAHHHAQLSQAAGKPVTGRSRLAA